MPPVTRDSVSRPDRSVTCCEMGWHRRRGQVSQSLRTTYTHCKGSPAQNTTCRHTQRTYHKCVVEGGEDVRHAKDVLALRGLGAEVQGLRVVDRLGGCPLRLWMWEWTWMDGWMDESVSLGLRGMECLVHPVIIAAIPQH
jgi:hypothetical protein